MKYSTLIRAGTWKVSQEAMDEFGHEDMMVRVLEVIEVRCESNIIPRPSDLSVIVNVVIIKHPKLAKNHYTRMTIIPLHWERTMWEEI